MIYKLNKEYINLTFSSSFSEENKVSKQYLPLISI